MRRSIIFLFLLLSVFSNAQVAPGKYFVAFTDKNNNPHSIFSPLTFLSQRAVNRRTLRGINITTQDLPVTPSYVDSVMAHGATVLNKTKWLNGVIIQTSDTNVLNAIEALPFVSGIKILHASNSTLKKDFVFMDKMEALAAEKMLTAITPDQYGPALGQIQMINGDFLHNLGYTGSGMLIAVLDAGFNGANAMAVFQNMINENRLLVTHDFAEGD